MYKLFIAILLYLFPQLLLADTSNLGFTPPISDVSVVFLSNLFGTVDTVLSSGGTGSQILGSMFMVFNSAVLALGGIIIIYTLIVSTMNTAHEGQMLGQKWSSIWIPLRSVLGIGLLIPKASGYCLMQIFVMWIVIQGVGAADKVWNAALSYLNRGGLIIQAQSTNPTDVLLGNAGNGVPQGAAEILSGQVCMIALQKQLTAQRQIYLDNTQNDKGPCAPGNNNLLRSFCDTPVPDFLNSVNAVDIQNQNLKGINFEVKMPNFPTTDATYSVLNGVCGTISWKAIDQLVQPPSTSGVVQNPVQKGVQDALTPDEYKTAQLARAIAIQQMYVDLSLVAKVMVTNAPQIGASPKTPTPSSPNFAAFAKAQYGVPLDAQSKLCLNYGQGCTGWGPLNPDFGVLFSGTEFQGAILDYNSIMQPTLNTIAKAVQASISDDDKTRDFIKGAEAQGWLMAGSYFFDLVKLNSAAKVNSSSADTDTGLAKSKFDPTSFDDPQYGILKIWFEKFQTTVPRLDQIKTLLNGGGLTTKPDLTSANPQRSVVDGQGSSSVYGYINNSMMIKLPGQQGVAPLQFAGTMTFSTSGSAISLTPLPWSCVYIVCIDGIFKVVFYNLIFLSVVNYLMKAMLIAMQNVMNAILWLPLQGIALIFKQGLSVLTQPGVNPVVALANMGVMYINFAGNLWIYTIVLGSPFLIFPPIFGIMMLGMPIIMSWLAVMVSISFITAYYIPLLPFMMFTFGGIGWLIIVIEAMVAAPLVALGITHPEGHEAFGKGEHAIMILLNVFLRPAMMIIGFIAAIAMTYVGVWVLNTGYDRAISYMQGGPGQQGTWDSGGSGGTDVENSKADWTYGLSPGQWSGTGGSTQGSGSGATQYTDWAGLFAFFFSILSYTTMYLIIVQKSFTLITALPDRVLRWIGGHEEKSEASQWAEEAKSSAKEAGEKSYSSQVQVGKTGAAGAKKGALWARNKLKGLGGGGFSVEEGKPKPPDK